MKKNNFKFILVLLIIFILSSCSVDSKKGLIRIENNTKDILYDLKIGDTLIAKAVFPNGFASFWFYGPMNGYITFNGSFAYPICYKIKNINNKLDFDYNDRKNLEKIECEFNLDNVYYILAVNDVQYYGGPHESQNYVFIAPFNAEGSYSFDRIRSDLDFDSTDGYFAHFNWF